MMAGVDGFRLPDGYRKRLPRSWQPWLDQLPGLVASYLERWELTAAGEFPLSYSYVLPVERADGRSCVLKVQPTGIPDTEGAERELLGLRLAGPVAVGVVEEDARNGVLLLDRVVPGTTLERMAETNDGAATEILAKVIRDYGRPVLNPGSLGLQPFAAFAGAFGRFYRGAQGSVAIRSARLTAERVLGELLGDPREPYLLHGDLHHGNVLLDSRDRRLVIDPWGLYGDRSADVAPALHNPIEFVARTPDIDALISRRLAIYAEVLDVDKEHLTAWCYVYDVIRVLWALQDHDEMPVNDAGMRTVTALRRLI